MNRRGFFLGAGALLVAPAIVRAASLMPVSTACIDAEAAEAAFAQGFDAAPRLTWEWGKGFRRGDRAIPDAEAFSGDDGFAKQLKLHGEGLHKTAFRRGLSDEFHAGYGPWTTEAVCRTRDMTGALDDPNDPGFKAWEAAFDADSVAWRQFRLKKHAVTPLPDWYIQEDMPSLRFP